MKTISESVIADFYVFTSMSIEWDSESAIADPCIFTTMSMELTWKPIQSACPAPCAANPVIADSVGGSIPGDL